MKRDAVATASALECVRPTMLIITWPPPVSGPASGWYGKLAVHPAGDAGAREREDGFFLSAQRERAPCRSGTRTPRPEGGRRGRTVSPGDRSSHRSASRPPAARGPSPRVRVSSDSGLGRPGRVRLHIALPTAMDQVRRVSQPVDRITGTAGNRGCAAGNQVPAEAGAGVARRSESIIGRRQLGCPPGDRDQQPRFQGSLKLAIAEPFAPKVTRSGACRAPLGLRRRSRLEQLRAAVPLESRATSSSRSRRPS